MNITIEEVKERLRAKEYKLTPQRQIILETFLNVGDKHLSAEDVYNIVKKQHPDIGLATVYRTLELLSELEVLIRMDFGDGRSRYELNEGDTHQHHHLICLQCGAVKEFEDDLLETLEEVIARKSKFKIMDHQLKFYGYCTECQQRAKHD
jgi:Fur family ferric uptake transcriptional regulator